MVDRGSPAQDMMFIGAGFDTSGGSPFVQARLALLGKTVFLLGFGFFAVNTVRRKSRGAGRKVKGIPIKTVSAGELRSLGTLKTELLRRFMDRNADLSAAVAAQS